MKLAELKYLADENIAPQVISFLRDKGFDIKSVIEERFTGRNDYFLIEYANDTDRVIITHDSDFGKIVFTRQITFTGMIYLRPGHFNPDFTITTLKTLLSRELELKFPFIIVAENLTDKIKIRVREL